MLLRKELNNNTPEMITQKQIFLESEANSWFERNHQAVLNRDYGREDVLARTIGEIINDFQDAATVNILEIGCGEGKRLEWIKENYGCNVYGIEPSEKAVAAARVRSVSAERGTADQLPFADRFFDVVVFGFCLYLCDRADLFRIAQEADRVLKNKSWLVIHDFYSSSNSVREYSHRHGVLSYKMDYRKLFEWHPNYVCYSHRVDGHGAIAHTDNPDDWVATSVLRKRSESV